MKPVITLQRETPWDRYEYPIVPATAQAHRPKRLFRVVLRSAGDVERARRQGLPFILVQSEDLKILHYPLRIPPTLIIPREYRGMIDTSFRLHQFQSLRALEQPRIEDLVVFLLSHDLIAARAVVERNRDLVDLQYLRKRIFQEDLEAEASRIHLGDFMDIPVVGPQLPRWALLRAIQGNRVKGILP